jgi:hypothetical protein
MIKLQKTAKPDVLKQNEAVWQKTYLDKLASGEKPTIYELTRYRHPDIKAALVAETHGKCAYCESKLKHIHHGDIEHIEPKSLYPEKRFEWDNLTYACEICNQNKSDNDPNHVCIIDPYNLDPSLHLTFVGALVFPLGTPEGKNTQVLLDLNRAALAEQRLKRLNYVMAILDQIFREDLPIATRRAIYNNLRVNEVGAQCEYSAMVRTAVDNLSKRLPPGVVT